MKNRVKEERIKKRMRLVDLANKSGVSLSAVWNVEQGYFGISLKTKEKVAKALGAEVKELFNE